MAQGCADIQNNDFADWAADPNSLEQEIPEGWSLAVGRVQKTPGTSSTNGVETTRVVQQQDGGVTLRNTPSTTHFLQLHQFFTFSDGTTELYELEVKDVMTTEDPAPRNAYVKLATLDETSSNPEFEDRDQLILAPFALQSHGSLLGYQFLESDLQRVSIFYDGVGSMMVGHSVHDPSTTIISWRLSSSLLIGTTLSLESEVPPVQIFWPKRPTCQN